MGEKTGRKKKQDKTQTALPFFFRKFSSLFQKGYKVPGSFGRQLTRVSGDP